MADYRTIGEVEKYVGDWIEGSSESFRTEFMGSDRKFWVLKFFSPRFLEAFLRDPRLAISATPGFTWGDGVYVTPLSCPYSTMMYGRIGVMGWVHADDMRRAYDASRVRGTDLYLEWIRSKVFLYRLGNTTIHANYVNRYLRNQFRRRFQIDVVLFPPDQYNRAYVAPGRDRWFCISDWSGVLPQAPGQKPLFSNKVRDCEWVVVVGEEFEKSAFEWNFKDLIGPQVAPPGIPRLAAFRANIVPLLQNAYAANRKNPGASPNPIYLGI
ncbi:MAG TPA: hypothetical protein VGG03_06410 [Thermoanaerobaculia bacterium]|jgi:hypothetical protein